MTIKDTLNGLEDMKIRRRDSCFISEYREDVLRSAIRYINGYDKIKDDIVEFIKDPRFGAFSDGASFGATRCLEIINRRLDLIGDGDTFSIPKDMDATSYVEYKE